MIGPDVVAIVLAGGASSRFGSDKLAASYLGRPVLHHALSAAGSVAASVVLVLGPDGPTPGLPEEVAGRVIVVRDREARGGPLAGLGTALDALVDGGQPQPIAIVVGGDMPRLVPAVLRRLGDRLAGDPVLDALTLAASPPSPLPMAIRIEAASSAVERCLADGRRSLRALLGAVRSRVLTETEWRALDPGGDTLADVDTPEDLALR